MLDNRIVGNLPLKNGKPVLATINNNLYTIINRIIRFDTLDVIQEDAPIRVGDLYVTAIIGNKDFNDIPKGFSMHVYRVLADSEIVNGVPVKDYLPYQENVKKSSVQIVKMLPPDCAKYIKGIGAKLVGIKAECEYVNREFEKEIITDPDMQLYND